jgi:hypothetical protein
MLKFKEYIVEAKDNDEFNLNDAKGKVFEILLGSHLHHGSDKNGNPNEFLSHYRDENKNSPQQVLSYIKDELDKRHPGMFNEINSHAKDAAEHVRKHLIKDGHHTIDSAAWTSQKTDHKSFTGEEDPNSDADVMIKTNHGPIGLSLKYGTQKQPNLRNPGLNSIESLANLKKGEVTDLYDKHQEKVADLGFKGSIEQNHKKYKENKNSPEAKEAEASSLGTRREIAKKWQDGYSRMSSDELKNKIVSLVSPETKFKHYRIHTRPTASGVEHHMGGIQDDVNDLLKNYAEFKAVPHSGEGISAHIMGRHHGSDEWHPVVSHSVKGVSGPMKNFAGTTKLLLRNKKAAPKETKKATSVEKDKPKKINNDMHGQQFYADHELTGTA